MEKSRLKNTTRNNLENFGLNREIDLVHGNNTKKIVNSQYLNEREMFNKFSNGNEIIDYTEIKHDESSFGMPIFNGQILNNKKSLISSPYIIENNNKDSFVSRNITMDSNDLYEEIDFQNQTIMDSNTNTNSNSMNDDEILNNMAYNSYTLLNKTDKTDLIAKSNININMEKTIKYGKDYICKVEKDIADFEFDINKNKSKEILVDINSPFALGYIWKSLVLLTKNPSTDKILKLLEHSNKDNLILDMKYNAEVFADSGSLELILPIRTQTINSNFISKISNIYHIDIKTVLKTDSESESDFDETKAIMNVKYNFKLDIPFYYQAKITYGYLQGYTKTKIKFLEMTNVPVSLLINREENYAILEIPCGSFMVLGFVYDINRQHVHTLPYKKMIENKTPDILVKKLIIPKINRNKKSPYGKKFKESLESIHLGEIVYGSMYDLDINVEIGLEIGTTQEVSKDKYEIKRNIDVININHKCYYYIRNMNIENKILSNGMINYN